MSENFTPLLSTYDWNEEWMELQRLRRHADDASFWDGRAKSFAKKDAPSPYVNSFLSFADLREGESVLDMGCGAGSISIPLAQAGHRVIAADFSRGMLDALEDVLGRCATQPEAQPGVHAEAQSEAQSGAHAKAQSETQSDADPKSLITPLLMSWADDWEAAGVAERSVDVAFASRSIATNDLAAALRKLSRTARRRACITLSTGSSPRTDFRMLTELGIKNMHGNDYQYALNILINAGAHPELNYIHSVRTDTFDDEDEAFECLARMVADVMGTSPEQALAGDAPQAVLDAFDRLHSWLAHNLEENPNATGGQKGKPTEKRLRLVRPRVVTWAFIAWDAREFA